MNRLKHLKDPLILFLILILTAGISLAASGDDFGSDSDDLETTQSEDYDTEELRSGFGDDTDDAGTETDSDTADSTENDDAGTSRNGFGDDIDDADTTQTDNGTDSDGDAGTSRNGFGSDTDDEGPSSSDGIDVDSDNESVDRDGFGNDTDDEGTSENNFGNDTDDEGSSRAGYGDEEESNQENDSENTEENESEENEQPENEESQDSDSSDSDGETTIYESADIEIVQNNDSESEQTDESSVEIQSVDWPNSVRQGSSFQVCAEVSASETPEVTLLKNGVEVETVSQTGNNCFTTILEQPGDHTLEIRAEIEDAQDSETATVNAYTLDSGTENQATGDFEDSTSSNNGLLLVGLLAVIAISVGAIYRYRGENP